MKKILYILGFLMLASAIASPSVTTKVFGQDTNVASEAEETCSSGSTFSSSEKCFSFSTARIFSSLNSAVSNNGKDWTDVFGSDNPEKAGQDIYAKIYDMSINQPESTAAKNIAGKYGVTEGDLTLLLNGNIAPILKKSPAISQEQAYNKIAEIQNKFAEEKDLLSLQADISAAVQPSEIFANDNLSDSGFDLVNDLNLIEKILFLKSGPIDIGANFDVTKGLDDPSSSNNIPGNQTSTNTSSDPSNGSTGSNNQTNSGNSNNGSSSGTSTGQNSGVNPSTCFTDSDLDKALTKFEENKKNDTHYQDESSGTENGGSTGSGATSANGSSQETATEEVLPFNEKPSDPVKAAPADNWLRTPPCTEAFCLSVNFVQKAQSVYQVSDNCIACHIEKINEKLKETTSHSLIPGKATGNLLEPGICKQAAVIALGSIGINFYAISKPVLTPANDDLIYGVGIEDEWKKFTSTYKAFSFDDSSSSTNKTPQPPQNEFDNATNHAVATASPQTTFEEITKTINEELDTNTKNRQEAIKAATVSLQGDIDSGFYQSVQRELEHMNYSFEAYQKILHSLHEKVAGISGDQACTEIKDKKVCG